MPRLEADTQAPEFEVETLKGEKVKLSDLRGQPVWIGFSRWASCPYCNYRIHQMVAEWPNRYAHRKFRHFNFFPSKSEKLEKYVMKHNPPFDLVSDPEQTQYANYGLESKVSAGLNLDAINIALKSIKLGMFAATLPDGPAFRIPADFLIDQNGVIRVAFYGKKITESIPFDMVDEFLNTVGC